MHAHIRTCTHVHAHTHAQVQLKGSVSSQYLTALLMAAPLSKGTEGIEIVITDELVSHEFEMHNGQKIEPIDIGEAQHWWSIGVQAWCGVHGTQSIVCLFGQICMVQSAQDTIHCLFAWAELHPYW